MNKVILPLVCCLRLSLQTDSEWLWDMLFCASLVLFHYDHEQWEQVSVDFRTYIFVIQEHTQEQTKTLGNVIQRYFSHVMHARLPQECHVTNV